MNIQMKTRQAYSELDEFIGLLTITEQNEIPKKLRTFIKEHKDPNYEKNINPNIPIKEQNFMEETLALIALLNLQYWCKDDKEKERLKKIYAENEKKYQEELNEKYNPDNLFKNKNATNIEEDISTSNAIVEYRKKSFFSKMFKYIRKIFKKG